MNAGEIGLQLRIRSSADVGAIGAATRSMTGLGDETKETVKGFGELMRGSREANMVLQGLERGGLSGTMQAMRGLQMMARSTGISFAELGSVIVGIAAPVQKLRLGRRAVPQYA
jgi:hypothetical protein